MVINISIIINMLYKVLYNVERINKVNFVLKDQNGKVMEATAHAGDLMKVKDKRPQDFMVWRP